MMEEKEIIGFFRMLNLGSESKRKAILSQGYEKSKKESIFSVVLNNNTGLERGEESKNAKLERDIK